MGLSGGKSEMLTIARRLLFSEGRGRGAEGGPRITFVHPLVFQMTILSGILIQINILVFTCCSSGLSGLFTERGKVHLADISFLG